MINLIPHEDRRQLRAARTNTLLIRYVVLMGALIAFIVIEMVVVYFIVNAGRANNEQIIKSNEEQTAQYADVKTESAKFQTNLATAKYILGKQTPYTTLLLSIANKLPDGAIIEKITIDPATFGTSVVLSVRTTSYDKSIQVKDSLQEAKVGDTSLFSSISFQSVARSQAADDKDPYPYTAIYNVTYSKEALTK